MVAHKIRIFGQIDGLQGEPSETLAAVDSFVLSGGGASATGLRTPLPVHYDLEILLCSQTFALPNSKLEIGNYKTPK